MINKEISPQTQSTQKAKVQPPQPLSYRAHPFLLGRWLSLKVALEGAAYTVRTQPNAWIEVAAICVVSGAGWWFQLAAIEWAILSFAFGLILALESINTAIEATIDLLSPDYHPLAKVAKDAAAGALIFGVLGTIGVAVAIFGPRLWMFL